MFIYLFHFSIQTATVVQPSWFSLFGWLVKKSFQYQLDICLQYCSFILLHHHSTLYQSSSIITWSVKLNSPSSSWSFNPWPIKLYHHPWPVKHHWCRNLLAKRTSLTFTINTIKDMGAQLTINREALFNCISPLSPRRREKNHKETLEWDMYVV